MGSSTLWRALPPSPSISRQQQHTLLLPRNKRAGVAVAVAMVSSGAPGPLSPVSSTHRHPAPLNVPHMPPSPTLSNAPWSPRPRSQTYKHQVLV